MVFIFFELKLKPLRSQFLTRVKNYGNQNLKFHLPIANTNLFKRDIFYQGPELWNSLPFDIRSKKDFLHLKL